MKRLALAAVLLMIGGCGGNAPISESSAASVSTWAGTYSGNLDFSGCPNSNPCGGDVVTLTISEGPNASIPGEFYPTITVSGTDSTTKETITGTGTALYYGSAPVGAGSEDTNANAIITPGGSIFLLGSGQSATGPVLIQTIAVHNTSTVAGVVQGGPLYFGTLTRSQ
jgi:hypothetical protein